MSHAQKADRIEMIVGELCLAEGRNFVLGNSRIDLDAKMQSGALITGHELARSAREALTFYIFTARNRDVLSRFHQVVEAEQENEMLSVSQRATGPSAAAVELSGGAMPSNIPSAKRRALTPNAPPPTGALRVVDRVFGKFPHRAIIQCVNGMRVHRRTPPATQSLEFYDGVLLALLFAAQDVIPVVVLQSLGKAPLREDYLEYLNSRSLLIHIHPADNATYGGAPAVDHVVTLRSAGVDLAKMLLQAVTMELEAADDHTAMSTNGASNSCSSLLAADAQQQQCQAHCRFNLVRSVASRPGVG